MVRPRRNQPEQPKKKKNTDTTKTTEAKPETPAQKQARLRAEQRADAAAQVARVGDLQKELDAAFEKHQREEGQGKWRR